MWRRTPADPAARAARIVTIAATVLFTLVICRLRPWNLFADAGFSNDFYDEQARSLLRLRLSVRPEVPGPEGFLIDGRTYLYYGPLLALARLPFALFGLVFTDVFAGRLTRLSMIIGFVVLCTGSYHLVETARRWAAPKWSTTGWTGGATGGASDGASSWRVGGFVAAIAASPALYLAGWVSVYHETELWAAAFATWALVGIIGMHADPSRRSAVLAAACIAAAILTRAPVGIGIATGAGIVALTMWRRERTNATNATIVIGACIAGFATHVAVNFAKFGSALDLPAERQLLSINVPERAAWFAGNHGSFFSLRFLPTTVVHYLRPDTVRFERLVPFIRYGPLATDRGSYPMEAITPAASLTTTATLVLAAGLLGAAALLARRAWIPLALVVGGAVAAVPTFTIGFVANRYLVDMLPMLMLPAAFAFATISVRTEGRARVRRVGQIVVIVLVVWGTWSNVALALWTQNLKEPGFTEMRYRIDDVLFGNPAPSLIVHDPLVPVARDGVVALALGAEAVGTAAVACQGVYIAEQGRWVPLERTEGARSLSGTVLPVDGTDVPIVGGESWSLVVGANGGRLVFALSDGDRVIEGEPIDWEGGPVHATVVADPVANEFFVQVDGTLGLFSFTAPTEPMLPFGDFIVAEGNPAGDSLCRRLQARL